MTHLGMAAVAGPSFLDLAQVATRIVGARMSALSLHREAAHVPQLDRVGPGGLGARVAVRVDLDVNGRGPGPRRAARAKAARSIFRCNNYALRQRLSAGSLSCARARFGGLCTSGARFRPRRTRQARLFRRSFIAWSSKCHARTPTFAWCGVYLLDTKAMDPISVFLVAFGVGCFTGVCLVLWSRYRRKTPPALPRNAATRGR